MSPAAASLRVVLYEGPGSVPLSAGERLSAISALLEAGFGVTRAGGPGPVSVESGEHPVLVVGQFDADPPAMPERSAGGSLAFCDITGMDEAAVLRAVEAEGQRHALARPGTWKPWFPVIDHDRCTNCMQCLSFCLFDVYSSDTEGRIKVQNESNCKTNCPACSRVCPEAAILFPKYGKGPINGDVVREKDLARESMKVDITALLGGDIYAALRTRSAEARRRFSTERDESRALLERKRCLAKLKKNLDIPDEVLMSLPSAGDIEERARRAREKATLRQARSRTVQDRQPAPTEEDWDI
ncbi:MAG: ferredoxin family protein [Acidobacteriota bacterium]